MDCTQSNTVKPGEGHQGRKTFKSKPKPKHARDAPKVAAAASIVTNVTAHPEQAQGAPTRPDFGRGATTSVSRDNPSEVHVNPHDDISRTVIPAARVSELETVPITFHGKAEDLPNHPNAHLVLGDVHPHAKCAFYRKVGTRQVAAKAKLPLLINCTEGELYKRLGFEVANVETSDNAVRRARATPEDLVSVGECLTRVTAHGQFTDAVLEDDSCAPKSRTLVLGLLARGIRVHLVGINPWLSFTPNKPYVGDEEYSSLCMPGNGELGKHLIHELRIAEEGTTRVVTELVPAYYGNGVWAKFVVYVALDPYCFAVRTLVTRIGGPVSVTSLTPARSTAVVPAAGERVLESSSHFSASLVQNYRSNWTSAEVETHENRTWFRCSRAFANFVEAGGRYSLPNAQALRRMLVSAMSEVRLVDDSVTELQMKYESYLYHKQTKILADHVEEDAQTRCTGPLAVQLNRVNEQRLSMNSYRPQSVWSMVASTCWEEVVSVSVLLLVGASGLSVWNGAIITCVVAFGQMMFERKSTSQLIAYVGARTVVALIVLFDFSIGLDWTTRATVVFRENYDSPLVALCGGWFSDEVCRDMYQAAGLVVDEPVVKMVDEAIPTIVYDLAQLSRFALVCFFAAASHLLWNLIALSRDRPDDTFWFTRRSLKRSSKLQCVTERPGEDTIYVARLTREGWADPVVSASACSCRAKEVKHVTCEGLAPSLVTPIYWANCACNKYSAYSRLVADIKYPDPGCVELFQPMWGLVLSRIQFDDFCSLSQYLAKRPLARADALLKEARTTAETCGLALSRDVYTVNLFVKFEPNFTGGVPRPIAPFHPLLQLALGPASHSLMAGACRLFDGSIESAELLREHLGLEKAVRVLYTAHLSGAALCQWLDAHRGCNENILLVNGDDQLMFIAGCSMVVECDGASYEASIRKSALNAEGKALLRLVNDGWEGRLLDPRYNEFAEYVHDAIRCTLTNQAMEIAVQGENGYYERVKHLPTRLSGAGTTSVGNTVPNAGVGLDVASRVGPDSTPEEIGTLVEHAGRKFGIAYTSSVHEIPSRGSFASGIFLPCTRLGVPSWILSPMLSACAKLYWPSQSTEMSGKNARRWIYDVAVGLRCFLQVPVLGAYVYWGLCVGQGCRLGGFRREWHDAGTYEVSLDTWLAIADRYDIPVAELELQDVRVRALGASLRNSDEVHFDDDWVHWPKIMAVDGRVLKSTGRAPTGMDLE